MCKLKSTMKLLVTAVLFFGLHAFAALQPIASWSFDDGRTNAMSGVVEFAPGVSGQCLVLDGLTTHLAQPAGPNQALTNEFTVTAWVALGSYPLNWSPAVDLAETNQCGFSLGVDAHGRFGLWLRAGENWRGLAATNVISLRQWHHLAATLATNGQTALFLDGKRVAEKTIQGQFIPPTKLDLLIGKSRGKAKPEGSIRLESCAEAFAFLDGALDELKIFDHALSPHEIAANYASAHAPAKSPLAERVLPAGPDGAFGAFYTRLKYYPQWDNPWRVGDFADVVVRFGNLPFKFIFWRGTSYIPNWVTENGIWFNNEFNETWAGVKGCGEPMSDKQTRYSNVRIIENSEARCVVHWRYALTDVFYHIAREDAATGWGDWSDEIYTIYPDGTSVRDITLHSTHPAQPHEWQESIVVMGPGFSPENSIEPVGLTLVNAAGEKVDYSWEKSMPPKLPGKPAHPVIQVINTKSRFKPFSLLRPQDNTSFNIYSGESRREVSLYPWWNHWPAATYASDGRYAMGADRASHSSLTHLIWDAYQTGPQWVRKIMLAGMTDQPAEKLLPLVRSWSQPPELKLAGDGYKNLGYDPAQKAYVLKCEKPGAGLAFEFIANGQSPVVNPALTILGWGKADAKLKLDGKMVSRGENFRWGHRQTIDGDDLIVWLKADSILPLKFLLTPK